MPDITGQLIAGRYQVREFIGRGGMAEVYRVFDNERSVELALKLLHADLAQDMVFLRRFRREAQTLASLQHPNIVRFYGLDKDGINAFILMDFIDGTTLRSEIAAHDGQPFSYDRTLEIMKPVCAALQYAHHQGFVHCDIKPANIMLGSHSKVQVADFGIARMTETATTTTMVGAGTPAYMAPEQILGEAPSPQTDIYALGIVLYEMLTGGERPFIGEQARITGSTVERLRWEQLNMEPASPRRYNHDLSPTIEALVLRCLEKDPARRFGSTMDLFSATQEAIKTGISPASAALEQIPVQPFVIKDVKPQQPVTLSQNNVTALPPTSQSMSRQGQRKKYPLYATLAMIALIAVFIGVAAMNGSSGRPTPKMVLATATINGTLSQLAQVTGTAAEKSTQTQVVRATEAAAQVTQAAAQAYISTQTALAKIPPPCTAKGQTWTSPIDGMILDCVPAGPFLMGAENTDKNADSNERPQHTVTLDAFWIDWTEITNSQFQKFVQKTGYQTDAEKKGSSYILDGNAWVDTIGVNWKQPLGAGSDLNGRWNYPVVHVSWNDAQAYCAWVGGSLPTEAQWEKAARGTDGRLYPWGNASPNKDLLNFNQNSGDMTAVGKYPAGASPYGVLDMAGNVREWVADWYSELYYASSPAANPTGPADGTTRTLRGGSWLVNESLVRTSSRLGNFPGFTILSYGFRCSRK